MEKISFSTVVERASGWTHQVQINAGDLADVAEGKKEFIIGEGLRAGDLIRDVAYYLKIPFKGPDAEAPLPAQQAAAVKEQPIPPAPEQQAPPPAGEAQPAARPEDQAAPGEVPQPPPEGQKPSETPTPPYEPPPEVAPPPGPPEPEPPHAEGEPVPGPFGGQVVRQPQEPQPVGAPQPKGAGVEAQAAAPTSVVLDVGHRESVTKDPPVPVVQEDTSLLRGYELAAGHENLTLAGNANGEQFATPPHGYAVKEAVEIFATFTAADGNLNGFTEGEVWIYLNVTRLPGVY